MTLTTPLIPEDLRVAYPRDTRAMGEMELEELLRVEERAIRSTFGVTSTRADADAALRDAMLAAWPSFLQQIRGVAQESAGADTYSVTYARGDQQFVFPAFLWRLLAGVTDAEYAPSSTQLVR